MGSSSFAFLLRSRWSPATQAQGDLETRRTAVLRGLPLSLLAEPKHIRAIGGEILLAFTGIGVWSGHYQPQDVSQIAVSPIVPFHQRPKVYHNLVQLRVSPAGGLDRSHCLANCRPFRRVLEAPRRLGMMPFPPRLGIFVLLGKGQLIDPQRCQLA